MEALGAEVLTMTVERHDEVLAAAAIPHLLAFSLVDTPSKEAKKFSLCGRGFRDFTGWRQSVPPCWHDIFHDQWANRKILDSYIEDLQSSGRHCSPGDSKELMALNGPTSRGAFPGVFKGQQQLCLSCKLDTHSILVNLI